VTLHEAKNAGYPDLGRRQGFAGTTAARARPRILYDHADLGSHPAGCFARLAGLAEEEDWAGGSDTGADRNAHRDAHRDAHRNAHRDADRDAHRDAHRDDGDRERDRDGTWVLRRYIESTFERLHRQRRVRTSPGGDHCAFNTGLATDQQETIYGLFVPNRNPDGPPWQWDDWLPESDPRLRDAFPEPPAPATYTDDPADFVFDVRRTVSIDARRLLESRDNLAVLPGPLRSNPYQAGVVLEGAARRAAARARHGHRTAIPCWDPGYERVHLLLPLSLTGPESVDVALVAAREDDIYRAHAVLGLDVAYARARQITRLETWLSPKRARG
jgi:uncharacterized protein DUF3825